MLFQPLVPPARWERIPSMLAHALGITFCIFGPLAVWQTHARRSPFIRRHSTEALNFQITLLVAMIAAWNFVPSEWVPLMLAGYITLNTVFSVPGIIAAARGRHYRYPYSLRLISLEHN